MGSFAPRVNQITEINQRLMKFMLIDSKHADSVFEMSGNIMLHSIIALPVY